MKRKRKNHDRNGRKKEKGKQCHKRSKKKVQAMPMQCFQVDSFEQFRWLILNDVDVECRKWCNSYCGPEKWVAFCLIQLIYEQFLIQMHWQLPLLPPAVTFNSDCARNWNFCQLPSSKKNSFGKDRPPSVRFPFQERSNVFIESEVIKWNWTQIFLPWI